MLRLSLQELNSLPVATVDHLLGFVLGSHLREERLLREAEQKANLNKSVTW